MEWGRWSLLLWIFHLLKVYILAVAGLEVVVVCGGLLRSCALRLLSGSPRLLGSLLPCTASPAKEAEDGMQETPQGCHAHEEEEQQQKAQTTEDTHRESLLRD